MKIKPKVSNFILSSVRRVKIWTAKEYPTTGDATMVAEGTMSRGLCYTVNLVTTGWSYN